MTVKKMMQAGLHIHPRFIKEQEKLERQQNKRQRGKQGQSQSAHVRRTVAKFLGCSENLPNLAMAEKLANQLGDVEPHSKNAAKRYLLKKSRHLNVVLIPKPAAPKPKKKASKDFYASSEWRALRYKILKKYPRLCMCCGSGPKNGVSLHVDHIKPRSKRPDLELDENNLQILCEDCNLGKSNTDEIDYR